MCVRRLHVSIFAYICCCNNIQQLDFGDPVAKSIYCLFHSLNILKGLRRIFDWILNVRTHIYLFSYCFSIVFNLRIHYRHMVNFWLQFDFYFVDSLQTKEKFIIQMRIAKNANKQRWIESNRINVDTVMKFNTVQNTFKSNYFLILIIIFSIDVFEFNFYLT